MVSSVIFSQASRGQESLPAAPAVQAASGSPSSGKAKPTSVQPSIDPLTRKAPESSPEITPADQRVMSDIQEIRAMLGGGLQREFEEINQALRDYPRPKGSSAGEAQANDRPDATVAQDPITTKGTTKGDWFSRELGQMVRARSQVLPTSEQVQSKEQVRPKTQQQPGKSPQIFPRPENGRQAQLDQQPLNPLRQCARELEIVAAALEQIEAYENADTVRREAVKLWEKARNE